MLPPANTKSAASQHRRCNSDGEKQLPCSNSRERGNKPYPAGPGNKNNCTNAAPRSSSGTGNNNNNNNRTKNSQNQSNPLSSHPRPNNSASNTNKDVISSSSSSATKQQAPNNIRPNNKLGPHNNKRTKLLARNSYSVVNGKDIKLTPKLKRAAAPTVDGQQLMKDSQQKWAQFAGRVHQIAAKLAAIESKTQKKGLKEQQQTAQQQATTISSSASPAASSAIADLKAMTPLTSNSTNRWDIEGVNNNTAGQFHQYAMDESITTYEKTEEANSHSMDETLFMSSFTRREESPSNAFSPYAISFGYTANDASSASYLLYGSSTSPTMPQPPVAVPLASTAAFSMPTLPQSDTGKPEQHQQKKKKKRAKHKASALNAETIATGALQPITRPPGPPPFPASSTTRAGGSMAGDLKAIHAQPLVHSTSSSYKLLFAQAEQERSQYLAQLDGFCAICFVLMLLYTILM